MAAIERFHIEARSAQASVRTLSGGNQQKVLLEKWLQTRPSVLLLNDVTRGVDIRTKLGVWRRSPPRRRRGAAIILYSTDTLELVGLAHRVLVFKEGQVNQLLVGDAITSEEIVRAVPRAGERSMYRKWLSQLRLEENWPVLTFVRPVAARRGAEGTIAPRFDLSQTLLR